MAIEITDESLFPDKFPLKIDLPSELSGITVSFLIYWMKRTERHGYNMVEYISHSEICLNLLANLGPQIGAYTLLEAMNPKVINTEIALS